MLPDILLWLGLLGVIWLISGIIAPVASKKKVNFERENLTIAIPLLLIIASIAASLAGY